MFLLRIFSKISYFSGKALKLNELRILSACLAMKFQYWVIFEFKFLVTPQIVTAELEQFV